ncbi:hypothetical protein TTHERM_000576919 (macronuclear) [Tetrahymena thermophila SB210]|uniref:Uncharacterized protein n=1 Tax=Tetrahymena thermophila (strain SB210) TaxID=312017 RepID=W7X8P5_TETTS|nr:hypothetical protein TTHERM_000576919 [Tetrahymena thermophila SB210]EWS75740.1 hypothetical protein TTHERM_000576919 [Tetrahymena thermophila SB210]|eukprot:XP_012651662.1 hypothetical protein TTHERM_000576919 [Tetrahymena thermophila SB210]
MPKRILQQLFQSILGKNQSLRQNQKLKNSCIQQRNLCFLFHSEIRGAHRKQLQNI